MAEDNIFWTNPSVLALAGDRDPVDVVVEKARQLVFGAIEEGWDGPPFDPFELAAILGIPVVPREELADARMVPAPDGSVRVEYNPTRPRGRVRFTIAHELAHTFFADHAEAIRSRAGSDGGPPDDWQLEMLCNIAAAELLMPIGSFTSLGDEPLKIEHIMQLRRDFDVSTEALLLRLVKLTDQPSAMFSAARINGNQADSAFRLDYVVGSHSWAPDLPRGHHISADSVLAECTAVGFTARAHESWSAHGEELAIECVGIPPYPGEHFPRIAGLLVAGTEVQARHDLTELIGDATEPRGVGHKLIVHLVNDKTSNWGGPFARALKEKWPQAQGGFREWADDPQRLQLGQMHVVDLDDSLSVATMVAQKGYGPSVKPRVRYAALRRCLDQVAVAAKERDADVHMPRIGTGEARGDWAVIRELLDETLVSQGIDVTVYMLPGTPYEESKTAQLALGA